VRKDFDRGTQRQRGERQKKRNRQLGKCNGVDTTTITLAKKKKVHENTASISERVRSEKPVGEQREGALSSKDQEGRSENAHRGCPKCIDAIQSGSKRNESVLGLTDAAPQKGNGEVPEKERGERREGREGAIH